MTPNPPRPARPSRHIAICLCLLSGTAKAADPPVRDQVSRQRQVLTDVDRTASRVTAVLRALHLQGLDRTAEHAAHKELASGLRSLSDGQIRSVLAHLEVADVSSGASAAAELRTAYAHHRKVLSALHAMLEEFDRRAAAATAAEIADRLALRQFTLNQRSVTAGIDASTAIARRDELADRQDELRADAADLLKPLAASPAPGAMPDIVRIGSDAADISAAIRAGDFRAAASGQLRVAHDLQAIAATLRPRPELLNALRDARDKVEAIRAAEVNPSVGDGLDRAAETQERLAFDTRGVRLGIATLAPNAVAELVAAEAEMRRSSAGYRGRAAGATAGREAAARHLGLALDALDSLIVSALADQTDPLAAVEKIASAAARLTREQAEAAAAAKAGRVDEAAGTQRSVARKAEAMRSARRPTDSDVSAGLDRSAAAARAAADALTDGNPKSTARHQDEAATAIGAAEKALAAQSAGIRARRDALAELEAAAAGLDELTRAQTALAAASNTTADRGREQESLIRRTTAARDALKRTAPAAATAAEDALRDQQAAADAFGRDDGAGGSRHAGQAALRLSGAANDVSAARIELLAREAVDQAALQPDRIDLAATAARLARAVEQVGRAAREAEAAESPDEGVAARRRDESARATRAALALVGQARATAPPAVGRELNGATAALRVAETRLGQYLIADARQELAGADRQLRHSLGVLTAAARMAGEAQQSAGKTASPPPRPPDAGGQPSSENQLTAGSPDTTSGRPGRGPATARGADATGDGTFIRLRDLTRDRVRQSAEAAFPAEFREQIKQYNINVKDDRPRPSPPGPK